jgi:Icc protein
MPFHLIDADSHDNAQSGGLDAARRGPNRREFLAGLAAGSSLLFDRSARADAERSPWYALVSDVHIAADPALAARGEVMARNLRAVVDDIQSLETPPLGMFIDGDLAFSNGQDGDYRTLLSLLEPIRKSRTPIHLTLGNHDDRAHFRTVLHDLIPTETDVVDKAVGEVTGPGLRFVLLDSLDKANVTPGRLGRDQLDWLAARLDAHPAEPTLVFVHHNLSIEIPTALTDTNELLAVVRPRRQVKGVIFGHTHVWNVRQDDGLYLINVPAVAYAFSPLQPLGWCRFRPEPGGGSLELRCVGGNRRNDRGTIALRWRADR